VVEEVAKYGAKESIVVRQKTIRVLPNKEVVVLEIYVDPGCLGRCVQAMGDFESFFTSFCGNAQERWGEAQRDQLLNRPLVRHFYNPYIGLDF
jgi:hypothetical protein